MTTHFPLVHHNVLIQSDIESYFNFIAALFDGTG